MSKHEDLKTENHKKPNRDENRKEDLIPGTKKLTVLQVIFLGLGMLVCLVPFIGMAFHPTEDSTENKIPAVYPSVTTKDGGLNTEYFEQFDA